MNTITWKDHSSPLAVLITALVLTSVSFTSSTRANVVFGVSGYENANYSCGAENLYYLKYADSYNTNGVPSVTYFVEPTLGHHGTITYTTKHGIYTLDCSVQVLGWGFDGGYMSGLSSTRAGNVDPYGFAYSNAQTQLIWQDVITVGGLPKGSSVTLKVTDNLYSWITAAGSYDPNDHIFESVNVGALHLTLSNLATHPVLHLQTSGFVTAVVGVPIDFELEEYAQANELGSSRVILDVSKAFANIQILTKGATLTSASGIDYSKLH